MDPILVHTTRGEAIESSHSVHALWVDEKGAPVRFWGDEERLVCPRSSFKAIQAVPLALSKGFEKSPNPIQALAISMSSHQAEDQHLEFVRKWLVILGRSEDELACGVEYPDEFARIRDILERRIPIGRAFNNCSGKHTGMIAACLASNFDPQNYNHWDHPLQKKIRQIATELSGFQWEKTPFGIDGCGLPIYHIPMNVFALTMSRFLRPELWPYADAMSLLRQAWIKEPYMIAGHGDVCSEITKITRGRICAKIGAQGNFVAFDFHQGRCLVLKVHDGDSRSAREALLAILLKSGSITSDEHSQLREFVPRNILNWAGDSVGFVTVQI